MPRIRLSVDTLEVHYAVAASRGNKHGLPRRTPTEEQEQIMLFDWIRTSHYSVKELFLLYYIPNGSFQKVAEAVQCARMGILDGIPNLHLPVARHKAHSLYIQLKALDGYPSQLQIERAVGLVEQGNCVAFAWGWEMAREILLWYLRAKGKK